MQRTNLPQGIRRIIFKFADVVAWILAIPAAAVAKFQWWFGPEKLPASFKIWNRFGVTPVPYHYYHPAFDPEKLPKSIWTREDPLRGIELRSDEQVAFLRAWNYAEEVLQFPLQKQDDGKYFYLNIMFGPGDAEVLYSMIRHVKPKRMVEIGSGFSTLIAKEALDRNRAEGHLATHVCIEPNPEPWLNGVDQIKVIQQRVEDADRSIFADLEPNDILFIDSSHVLRIGGDVRFEYLELLPSLKNGVLIHIHDIFLPFEYPIEWPRDSKWYWTEQQLLQAFLAFNSEFEVVLALSYLHAHHRSELARVAPILAGRPETRPGSFWIRRKPAAA